MLGCNDQSHCPGRELLKPDPNSALDKDPLVGAIHEYCFLLPAIAYGDEEAAGDGHNELLSVEMGMTTPTLSTRDIVNVKDPSDRERELPATLHNREVAHPRTWMAGKVDHHTVIY